VGAARHKGTLSPNPPAREGQEKRTGGTHKRIEERKKSNRFHPGTEEKDTCPGNRKKITLSFPS